MKQSRRYFIKKLIGFLGLIYGFFGKKDIFSAEKILSKTTQISNQTTIKRFKTKVIIARNVKVWNGNKINEVLVKEMLNKSLLNLTNSNSSKESWSKLFSKSDTVGIKVNAISGRNLSTRPEIISAIISGLKEAGVDENNIIVWDRFNIELKSAGYKINQGSGVKCFGTDAVGYDEELTISGSVASRVSKIASSICSVLINVSLMKDHEIAGVTLCLKNYYGAVDNPNKMHQNGCNPFIADLNMMPVFSEKTKLYICDALIAQYNGGPGYKPSFTLKYGGMLVSTDPVAIDRVGWNIIEDIRKEKGLLTLKEEDREPVYIRTAGDSDHKLGVNDLSKIEIIQI